MVADVEKNFKPGRQRRSNFDHSCLDSRNLVSPSPLKPEILDAIKKATSEFWPGIPVIPSMSTGATDGSFLRNAGIPVYGTSGLANDIGEARARNGKDERVIVKSFSSRRQDYLYRLVKLLASTK